MKKTIRILATIRALLPSVLTSLVLSIVGLLIVREFVPTSTLKADGDMVGNYLQTLGSIYAVLLAFVVFVVWSQFNEARGHVEREANELLDFCRTARGFPKDVCRAIYGFIQDYTSAVLDKEWRAMERDDEEGTVIGWTLLDRVSDSLHAFEPQTEVHKLLYAEILARLNGLCDARTSRLSSGRIRIPFAIRILLYTGAVIIVGSMYLLPMESVVIHIITTAAMAGAISHLIYVIEDLDDCFAGDWRVPRSPFTDVQKYLNRVNHTRC